MFDMTKETGAFHNIYKTGVGAETEKRILQAEKALQAEQKKDI